MAKTRATLLQGTLDLLILKALNVGELHVLTLSLLVGICLSGCSSVPPNAPSAPPVHSTSASTDDLGRLIKLEKTPRRIVTIGPGATETVFSLGAGDLLVGRDSGSDYPAAALKVPVVANFTGPFFEKVAAVRPDFIIVQGETWDESRVNLWQEKCGAPVAALSATTLGAVSKDIEKIGFWLDVPDKARALNKKLLNEMYPAGADGTQGKSNRDKDQRRAFVEVARSPLFTAGSGTLIDEVVRAAGLGNIASDIKGYKQYNLESLASKQPDVYIVTDSHPDKARVLRELRALPGLRNLKCIQAGRILVLPADLLLRPGPRLGTGITMLRREAAAVKY